MADRMLAQAKVDSEATYNRMLEDKHEAARQAQAEKAEVKRRMKVIEKEQSAVKSAIAQSITTHHRECRTASAVSSTNEDVIQLPTKVFLKLLQTIQELSDRVSMLELEQHTGAPVVCSSVFFTDSM
tara:strand:- start:5277 stop:5657 length:381 start_codon:yes stop_codon:yes gene_type:complete